MTILRAFRAAAIGRTFVFATCSRQDCRTTQRVFHLSLAPRSYHGATPNIYGPLNHANNEIRVIRIKPGRWDDDISCSSKVISLDGLLRTGYDTLSYTWGNPKDTKTIRVDQQDINVSTNLFMGLRAVRRTFTTATIWADALCINQKDGQEKSNQVTLMGRIYKQGRQTWVSLGYPDEKWADRSWSPAPHIPEKARMLNRLIRGVWRLGWHHLVLRRSRNSRLGVNHISDAVRIVRAAGPEPDPDNPGQEHEKIALSMLTWLACHDYWSRVWIVQEIALSRYDPICIFGRHQIPLLSLETVFDSWSKGNILAFEDWEAVWTTKVGKGLNRAQEICLLRDEFLSTWKLRLTGSMELSRALQLASYRRASIAHDHVYGLRSLLSTKEQESLQPDYSLSVRELYASVTNLLLQEGNSTNLLCAAVGTRQLDEHDLPSWSLDFSKPLTLPAREADSEELGDFSGELIGSGVLQIQGRDLGEKITHVYSDNILGDLRHDPVVSKILSTEIWERNTYRKEGLEWYREDTETDSQQANLKAQSGGQANSVKGASDSSNHDGRGLELFLTGQGKLAKCSKGVLQGDEIWAFVGSKTTFVLRPLPEEEEGHPARRRYSLVGPCIFLTEVTNTTNGPGLETQLIEIV
jgi:hypothetical protein